MLLKQILAVLSTLAFCVYHITIDQFYRPSADDFAAMHFASNGIPGIGYAVRFYFEWEGPFLSMIVQGLWMKLLSLNVPGVVILFSIKAMLLASSIYMVEGIIEWLSGKRDWALAVLGGTALMTTMYLISSEQSEIWHWVMGSVVYLHPILFLQLAIGLLLRGKTYWAILPLAYLMESRATYAVLLFGLITLVTIWSWVKNTDQKKKMLFMNGVLLISLLIYILAPGNSKRVSQGGFEYSHYLYQYSKEIKNAFLSFNLAKTDRILMGLMLLVPLLPNLRWERIPKQKAWLLLPAVAYILFVLAHGVIFVLATGYAAWLRVYSMHSFLFIICCLFYGYLFYQRFVQNRLGKLAPRVIPILALLLMLFSLFKNYPNYLEKGKEYSQAYDVRAEKIFSYQGTSADTLRIERLPDPGVLYYWEFSTDPLYWINKDFRNRYQTAFYVAVSEE